MAGTEFRTGLEAPGTVSIWAGRVRDEDELLDHVSMGYGDEGGSASRFQLDTGIGWYDEDFAEGSVSDDPVRTLAEHSYGPTFAGRAGLDLADRPGVNALYLVYGCDAAPLRDRPGLLTLLGTYPYDPAPGAGGE
ncbi:immunity 22 family protein [Kitasatospora sp. NPDC058965]|uniref:immunity 22 family protein n=1 Tax=Kitasatospora sp. NPDC058965 TaxID=3346682 RepID=UPI003696BF77